jgi:hypothetical protein
MLRVIAANPWKRNEMGEAEGQMRVGQISSRMLVILPS